MGTLLIITTGQSDVQLVKDDKRMEFDRDKCGELHLELKRRKGAWRLVDAPPQKGSGGVDQLPKRRFELCTPKLDAVLTYLAQEGMGITHALILETRRDLPRERTPMAGRILRRRLEERVPGVHIWLVAYLIGNEDLEDRTRRQDGVVRWEVAHRIEAAVVRALARAQPQWVVVSATGGFPNVTTLVEEIVRLYVLKTEGVRVEVLDVPDGAKANPPGPDRAVPRLQVPEPAEVFRARRHALELITRGDLVGAWGAVRHIDDNKNLGENERNWTRVVNWLYWFAVSLPVPAECDVAVLRHPSMAARTALRVELALRARDIPRAVLGTVAFYEAALWDHLRRRVERHPSQRLYRFRQGTPPAALVGSSPDRPFKAEANGWYRIRDDRRCAPRLTREYLNLPQLTELGKMVLDDAVYELRNDVAHNEPTPDLMESARRVMLDKQLWSEGYDGVLRFLSQPLVQAVLKECGVRDRSDLYDRLMQDVRRWLLVP